MSELVAKALRAKNYDENLFNLTFLLICKQVLFRIIHVLQL